MIWLLEPILMLRDLAVALIDVVTGRHRRRYAHTTLIHAAHDAVWQFMSRPRMRFERVDLEMVDEPIPGMADAYRTRMTVRGQELPPAAYQKIHETEGSSHARYLPSIEPAWGFGDDHLAGKSVTADPDGARLTLFEELTPTAFHTRLYVPFALRSASRLIKEQCEAEAGHAPPAGAGRFAGHAALWIAAILSFWYLLGLAEALLLTVIVVLHELGHALAMRMVGLPVGFVTLVPFIGGMAAPKKDYESSFQHAFVALMGPGFSLVPTLALAGWYAYSDQAWAGWAAFMFAILNGVNLLPLYPLDGGVVANHLLGAVDSRLGRAGAWGGVVVGVAAAVLQSILIGIVFVLAAIMLFRAQGPALPLRPLHPVDFTAVLIGYVVALALYIACVSFTVDVAA